jgi:hypothetical protein
MRQRKIVPGSNVGVQNRAPMHGRTDQLEKGNCEKILDWARNSWRKSIASVRRAKTCAGKVLKKVMDKKREWDEWDPNKDHPVARCIESNFRMVERDRQTASGDFIQVRQNLYYLLDTIVTNGTVQMNTFRQD